MRKWLKFGQKVFAKRTKDGEWEQAVGIKYEMPHIMCVFPDGEVLWLHTERVLSKQEMWAVVNKEKVRLCQRNWRIKKKAAEKGITLEEYVYWLEARKAERAAKKDPKEKQREYWRQRQAAHRAKETGEDAVEQ